MKVNYFLIQCDTFHRALCLHLVNVSVLELSMFSELLYRMANFSLMHRLHRFEQDSADLDSLKILKLTVGCRPKSLSSHNLCDSTVPCLLFLLLKLCL